MSCMKEYCIQKEREELENIEKEKFKKMLVCKICNKPYKQVSKYEWKGDCEHKKNLRVSVG